ERLLGGHASGADDGIAVRRKGAFRRNERERDVAVASEPFDQRAIDGHAADESEQSVADAKGVDSRDGEESTFWRPRAHDGDLVRGMREEARKLGLEAVELVAKVSRTQNSSVLILELEHR